MFLDRLEPDRPSIHDAVLREVFAYLPELIERGRSPSFHYQPLHRGPGWRDPHVNVAGPTLHPIHTFQVRVPCQEPLVGCLVEALLVQAQVEAPLQRPADRRVAPQTRRDGRMVRTWLGLVLRGVRCVAIGGAAATMHGSARITRDLDVCYDPATDNTDRLAELLTTGTRGSTWPFPL